MIVVCQRFISLPLILLTAQVMRTVIHLRAKRAKRSRARRGAINIIDVDAKRKRNGTRNHLFSHAVVT